MEDSKQTRGGGYGKRYCSPKITVAAVRIENGFAASSLNLDNKSIDLDGFDINNPDGSFSADE